MKLKNKIIETDDFYHDLIDEKIKLEDILQNKEDIDKISNAIKILQEFKDLLENNDMIDYY